MKSETTLALNLIREHYDGTDDSFREASFDLARYYDNIDKQQLSEYIFALVYPEASFTTFEIDYHKGQIICTKDDAERLYRYKIVSVEASGVYVISLDKNCIDYDPNLAYFIHYNDLMRDYWIEKSNNI